LAPQQSPSKEREWLGGLVGLVAVAAATVSMASWIVGSGWEATFTKTAVVFVLFVALGEQLEIPLPRGGVFALGLAPALGYSLLRQCAIPSTNPCESFFSPQLGQVVAVFVVGSVASILLGVLRHRKPELSIIAARLLVVVAAAAVYRAILPITPDMLSFGPTGMSLLGLAAVIVVVLATDVVLGAMLILTGERLPPSQVLASQFRTTAPLLVSTISVAALLSIAYAPLRAWTLPLFLVPLAATAFSFRQVESIRQNYLQTVRALSKVPEMAGYTQSGHSTRVATMSVEIAKELGISDPNLSEIEYAALLHDIGRISFPDPEEATRSTSNLQLALVGSEIIEETGHLPVVARIVRDQNEPYRRRGQDINRTLSTGSKIIKVASAYDDLTQPPGPGRAAWDALERLHVGMAYDFDPAVIQALTRVLEKEGSI
jgi:putative nucleotidyltransferase with HDIG domain